MGLHDEGVGQFLSTPSARRATHRGRDCIHAPYISIHALREEGDRQHGLYFPLHAISIHALREEGDVRTLHLQAVPEISIHALREEGDPDGQPRHLRRQISIHALREEGDLRSAVSLLFW